MPAVTTAVIATGAALAGTGMSIAQAVKAKKDAKAASEAAATAANTLKNINQVNAMSKVQVPTLGSNLAQQGIDRATQSALSVSQGAGAEGVIGGVGQIMQASNEQELKLAAQANDLEYQRNTDEAVAQNQINAAKFKQLTDLEQSRLEGAQDAEYQAQANRNAAIQNAITSGTKALGIGGEALPLFWSQKEQGKAGSSVSGVSKATKK